MRGVPGARAIGWSVKASALTFCMCAESSSWKRGSRGVCPTVVRGACGKSQWAMLLPERSDALVEDGTVDYFLDPDRDKAGFVLRFGFDAQTLKTALLEQARAASVDAGPRRTDTELAELVGPLPAPADALQRCVASDSSMRKHHRAISPRCHARSGRHTVSRST